MKDEEVSTDSEKIPLYPQAGLYKIYTALNSRMLVDMSLTADSNGYYNVKLYPDRNEVESTWAIIYNVGGQNAFSIVNATDQFRYIGYLGPGYLAANGGGDSRSYWHFQEAGDGLYYIVNSYNSNIVVDVKGSNTAVNTDIIPWEKKGSLNQKFRLVRIGEYPWSS
ncbi:RICIN domain-containing protein [Pseudomonas corrugata]|uniref:RICIN domain-containing protein n=1 Tax=Pseudomonas corrugata TaxID=47879 RepID=UPI00158670A1|nr:RICIN domain-containing protein [Pseudomonas corrugata]MCI0994524.1 RICIN domain-containing protein [Pseudomonas corrugata]NUT68017.1 RICIN domain-containing protein [Pseudomonas corrugata]